MAYEIPIFPGAQDVSRDFMESMVGETRTSVVYSVAADASEVENFYKDKLAADGWIWVYTDSGESLTATLLSPSMMMEFQRDGHKLGIAVHGFGGFGANGIVLAGTDISSGELTMNFVGAVSGGLDWMGPSEIDTRADAMHFTSTLVEFSHSFYWLPTDQLLEIYESDKAVNYRPHTNSCKINMEICFVNFWVGHHFDIPISIRVHPEMAGLTLEEADAQRWEELNLIAAAQERKYYFPEELAVDGSLESMDVYTLTLADGTPAIQRMYRWKQEDVAEPIISTYTLFVSRDVLIEFRTDFIKEEWEEWQPTIKEVIAGIKAVP